MSMLHSIQPTSTRLIFFVLENKLKRKGVFSVKMRIIKCLTLCSPTGLMLFKVFPPMQAHTSLVIPSSAEVFLCSQFWRYVTDTGIWQSWGLSKCWTLFQQGMGTRKKIDINSGDLSTFSCVWCSCTSSNLWQVCCHPGFWFQASQFWILPCPWCENGSLQQAQSLACAWCWWSLLLCCNYKVFMKQFPW